MTSTTLGNYDMTSAILANLIADTTLSAALVAGGSSSDEIREVRWMGDEFVYPAVRFELNEFPVDEMDGNCHGRWFRVSFSVYIYSEDTSSKECQTLMRLVRRRFQNRKISSATLESMSLDTSEMPVVPDRPNVWRGEVVITGMIKDKVP
jgi:hypothetical protein